MKKIKVMVKEAAKAGAKRGTDRIMDPNYDPDATAAADDELPTATGKVMPAPGTPVSSGPTAAAPPKPRAARPAARAPAKKAAGAVGAPTPPTNAGGPAAAQGVIQTNRINTAPTTADINRNDGAEIKQKVAALQTNLRTLQRSLTDLNNFITNTPKLPQI